jgi:hypothetical protein
VWLLDERATPASDALDVLLAAAGDAPVVAGRVVHADGAPCRAAAPRPAEREPLLMVDTAGDGRLPIRYATLAHTLVAAAAIRERGGPDARLGAYAAAEWTARLLAGRHGWWATRSVVTVDACPDGPAPTLRARLRMLRTGTWTAAEAVEELLPIDRADRPQG